MKSTNPLETYLPVGTFRNVTCYVTDPCMHIFNVGLFPFQLEPKESCNWKTKGAVIEDIQTEETGITNTTLMMLHYYDFMKI